MSRRDKFSVVIPVYNEEEVLTDTYNRLKAVMDELDAEYELIFVNDGSVDSSASCLDSLCALDGAVKVITFSRNFGHQVAISAGMENATGDAVVVIDADLQDPPELIPEIVAAWRAGYDVVYAKRTVRHGETRFKRWSATLFYRTLRWMADVDIPLDAGDFRLIDRKVCDILNALPEQHRFVRGLIGWLGFRQTEVAYERSPRFAGETKYSVKQMIHLATDAVTSFSDKPLKIPMYLGGILTPLCVVTVIAWIGMALFAGKTFSGADWLGVLGLMMSGVVLLALGVLGQYVSRIYDEVRNRPLYIVDKKQGFERDGLKRSHLSTHVTETRHEVL